MATDVDTISAAAGMICKAAVLAASWAGARRRRALEKIAALTVDDKDKEIILLREEVGRFRDHLAFLQKRLGKGTRRRRYSIGEKLFVVLQMEYLGLPRRLVTEYSGVARSTLYRWLHRIDSPFYPNHVWSADLCMACRWGLWPTYVLVVIDHFSRKVMTVSALKRPSAACAISALEQAFRALGPPKHLISDRQGLFTGETFSSFLKH